YSAERLPAARRGRPAGGWEKARFAVACDGAPGGMRGNPMASARTESVPAPGPAGDGDFTSAAQRDRRKRILDATLALASKGGYDAVQMRTVAERADVALGTLYRYFPSKIHLLVSALTLEFERI